jgi:uridine phosphorylase
LITAGVGSAPRERVSLAFEPKDDAGRPYHIRLDRKSVGRIALLPGDPGRVPKIAERLKRAEELSSNREFTAYGGYVGNQRVVVMSTGIGGPATAIAIEELARLGVRVMVRVGTCGAITPKATIGSIIIPDCAFRMEGTSTQYVGLGYPAAATPGVVLALANAAKRQKKHALVGVAASTDSFYAGQGRKSFGGYYPSANARLLGDLAQARVLCFEMEAATLFTLGRLFGLSTGAVLGVVGNRVTDEFKPDSGVDAAIDIAIGSISLLSKFGV